MKSSLILSLILASFVTSSLWAQSTKKVSKKKVETKVVAPVVVEEKAIPEKDSFNKFYDRLRIAYFSAYSGSSLGGWDKRAMDEHGAKSKEYVHNLFNQVSFNYSFGAKLNFVLNPRWTVNTASTSAYGREGNGLIVVEDLLAGFQGVIYTSEDKKFNWWMRAGLRLPTSRASRRADITFQPDLMNIPTYDFNPTWQLGAFLALRQWVFEDHYSAYRYRVYVAPYVQYAFNDKTRLQVWWETYAENRNRLPSQNDQKQNFQEYWQDILVGVNHDINARFNVFPFLGYLLNTTYGGSKPLDATYVGAWISYQIK
jgi:hypothetical protein